MQRTIRSAALLLVIALAAPAHASEGTLEIFPDIVPVLFDPLRWPETHFFQLIVLFVLLIFPVNQLVLKPLLGVLDDRSARIEGARKRAGEVGAEAETVLGRYRAAVELARKQAEELRKGALESARGDQARILSEARKAAESEVATARSGVASAIAGARATLRGQSEGLAREAAASVLGRPLS
jgi:F-type H+-transporting ATPase subunit b